MSKNQPDAFSRDLRHGIRGGSGEPATDTSKQHPTDMVRLGLDPHRGQWFDLSLAELGQHVFIPGASGTGKSTTIGRIADGCMQAGWGVVILDCKGSGLGATARALAMQHRVPLNYLDPNNPDSMGFNPCTGDGPAVANKLVGAFSFADNAEIYENISMNVLSVTVDALRSIERPVTIDSLAKILGTRGGLTELAKAVDSPAKEELIRLGIATGLTKTGIDGMAARLRALASGRFGNVLRAEPALDWNKTTNSQQVTFFALSSTAASRDVNLLGRVIAQDIKQLCDRRLRASQSEPQQPLLLIVDEFAVLNEARQFVDLLLQARQARISLVLATQLLPTDEVIRKSVVQSGVLILHRVEAEDAAKLATQLGTHTVTEHSWSPAQTPDETDHISIRLVEKFTVSPNELRRLHRPGLAVVMSVATQRHATVQILPFDFTNRQKSIG